MQSQQDQLDVRTLGQHDEQGHSAQKQGFGKKMKSRFQKIKQRLTPKKAGDPDSSSDEEMEEDEIPIETSLPYEHLATTKATPDAMPGAGLTSQAISHDLNATPTQSLTPLSTPTQSSTPLANQRDTMSPPLASAIYANRPGDRLETPVMHPTPVPTSGLANRQGDHAGHLGDVTTLETRSKAAPLLGADTATEGGKREGVKLTEPKAMAAQAAPFYGQDEAFGTMGMKGVEDMKDPGDQAVALGSKGVKGVETEGGVDTEREEFLPTEGNRVDRLSTGAPSTFAMDSKPEQVSGFEKIRNLEKEGAPFSGGYDDFSKGQQGSDALVGGSSFESDQKEAHQAVADMKASGQGQDLSGKAAVGGLTSQDVSHPPEPAPRPMEGTIAQKASEGEVPTVVQRAAQIPLAAASTVAQIPSAAASTVASAASTAMEYATAAKNRVFGSAPVSEQAADVSNAAKDRAAGVSQAVYGTAVDLKNRALGPNTDLDRLSGPPDTPSLTEKAINLKDIALQKGSELGQAVVNTAVAAKDSVVEAANKTTPPQGGAAGIGGGQSVGGEIDWAEQGRIAARSAIGGGAPSGQQSNDWAAQGRMAARSALGGGAPTGQLSDEKAVVPVGPVHEVPRTDNDRAAATSSSAPGLVSTLKDAFFGKAKEFEDSAADQGLAPGQQYSSMTGESRNLATQKGDTLAQFQERPSQQYAKTTGEVTQTGHQPTTEHARDVMAGTPVGGMQTGAVAGGEGTVTGTVAAVTGSAAGMVAGLAQVAAEVTGSAATAVKERLAPGEREPVSPGKEQGLVAKLAEAATAVAGAAVGTAAGVGAALKEKVLGSPRAAERESPLSGGASHMYDGSRLGNEGRVFGEQTGNTGAAGYVGAAKDSAMSAAGQVRDTVAGGLNMAKEKVFGVSPSPTATATSAGPSPVLVSPVSTLPGSTGISTDEKLTKSALAEDTTRNVPAGDWEQGPSILGATHATLHTPSQ